MLGFMLWAGTQDFMHARQALYQLSYVPTPEPPSLTSGLDTDVVYATSCADEALDGVALASGLP